MTVDHDHSTYACSPSGAWRIAKPLRAPVDVRVTCDHRWHAADSMIAFVLLPLRQRTRRFSYLHANPRGAAMTHTITVELSDDELAAVVADAGDASATYTPLGRARYAFDVACAAAAREQAAANAAGEDAPLARPGAEDPDGLAGAEVNGPQDP